MRSKHHRRAIILSQPAGLTLLRPQAWRLLSLIACTTAHNAALAQCSYTRIDIPDPPGFFAQPNAISDNGLVAGELRSGSDYYRGFIWSEETGTQVMPRPPGFLSVRPYAINNLGHVVGEAVTTTTNITAFFWDGSTYTLLPRPLGSPRSEAYGINDAGQIVGYFETPQDGLHAALWENGQLIDLSFHWSGAWSTARGINANGDILIQASDWGPIWRGIVVSNGRARVLDCPNGCDALVYAMNEYGDVAGSALPLPLSDPDFVELGAIWPADAPPTLIEPPVGSRDLYFTSINNSRVAVGLTQMRDYGSVRWDGMSLQYLNALVPATERGTYYSQEINNFDVIACDLGVLVPNWDTELAGDFNTDCVVDLLDLAQLLSEYGAEVDTSSPFDLNADGHIGIFELATVLANWYVTE